jgi:hypothetical protein
MEAQSLTKWKPGAYELRQSYFIWLTMEVQQAVSLLRPCGFISVPAIAEDGRVGRAFFGFFPKQ